MYSNKGILSTVHLQKIYALRLEVCLLHTASPVALLQTWEVSTLFLLFVYDRPTYLLLQMTNTVQAGS